MSGSLTAVAVAYTDAGLIRRADEHRCERLRYSITAYDTISWTGDNLLLTSCRPTSTVTFINVSIR